ncbi:hypothetical protein S7711_02219 [Stachybotrys chartarum IBT 7711]|uniref:Uncharacterized protein n=1 Tax=Stachybotrys chartarum (strain CBS 109288 / IBT 7711) TaxID=1280523 RepID=A0A084AZ86_STACB|nr:hypothetical protein S7711_02219 [Stachybotrys chartarum IBT 7711]KFA53064.1 hypothetical protein S40293_05344 [Stachybotrys chartarum IBT 40293]
MSPTSQDSSSENRGKDEAIDLAQAYRDILKGEQAATAIESNLTNLERKLDAMLAAIEGAEAAEVSTSTKEANGKQQPEKLDQEKKSS